MKTEIEKYRPCKEAVEFRKHFDTFKEAWNACPRGDWMLWLASKVGVDIRTLTLAKGKCAETVIHLMQDNRSKDAVKAAIDFGEGRISDKELADYAASAYAADYADSAAYAADYAASAYAADYADSAASAAAYAASAAAYAASAYASAADYAAAAYAAAVKENQMKTANICRELLSEAVFELIKQQDR